MPIYIPTMITSRELIEISTDSALSLLVSMQRF